jgi:hypothetical protein
MTRGRLYVVPNLLGIVSPDAVLPARTIASREASRITSSRMRNPLARS